MHQAFTPFKREPEAAQQVRGLLTADDLGPDQPYLDDPLLRQLYWKNLIRPVAGRLRWRCTAIRDGGLGVLGCE